MRTSRPIVTFETALGRCAVSWSDAGITGVELPSRRTAVGPRIEDGISMPEEVQAAIAGMIATLAGESRDLRNVAIDDLAIDPFRRRVYDATRAIPPGSTATYGDIARAIGSPEGARDVGAALARNPFPIVVPCHRVIAASGALHGFSAPGGLATKRRMLELEGAPGFGQQVLFG
jgi:methylated-DNA-[protein]-cysteine S-methyltransferase